MLACNNVGDGVQANDYSPDGNPLTSVLESSPANGTVQLNPDGSFSYTPYVGFSGMDSFTYYDLDGEASSNLATVNIIVYAAPVANDDYYTGGQGDTLTVMNAYPFAVGWTDTSDDDTALNGALSTVPNIVIGPTWYGDGTLDSSMVDFLYYNVGANLIVVYNQAVDSTTYAEAANLGIFIIDSDDLHALVQEAMLIGNNIGGGVQANDSSAAATR